MTTAVQIRRGGPRLLYRTVPPALRPALRSFLIGYASAVGPRLLSFLVRYAKSKRVGSAGEDKNVRILDSLRAVLASGLGWNRFPAFCALLVGGSTFLEAPLRRLLQKLLGPGVSALALTRLVRWLSTFFAAALSVRLLQSRRTPAYTEMTPATKPDGSHADVEAKPVFFAGRTLDLTLFAAVRAADVVVRAIWARTAANSGTRSSKVIANLADPAVFAVSSAAIMWSWFFTPSRLPGAYRQWISAAAAVDPRLIEALRRCHAGELRYGEDTGQADLLGSMCTDLGLPPAWGDPAVTNPFPCEIVHMNCGGASCEYHALSRFVRSYRWSLATYLPLSLVLQLRRKPTAKSLRRAVLSAARSSAFLGTFITLFYYGVCLARNRIGPRILGNDTAACNAIDGGICVGTGCALCGWSILIEATGRRPELTLFVAPRALATVFPRRYDASKEWRETVVFAASAAVVFSAIAEDKRLVRGVLGKLIGSVMKR